jgi:hypothetical protein
MPFRRKETKIMRTLISAVALLLSTATGMAEAPCENPVAPACQKACAVMGAKYVLSIREQSLPTPPRVQIGNAGSLESAQRLARFAGLPLLYIDGLTVPQIKRGIALYCPHSGGAEPLKSIAR